MLHAYTQANRVRVRGRERIIFYVLIRCKRQWCGWVSSALGLFVQICVWKSEREREKCGREGWEWDAINTKPAFHSTNRTFRIDFFHVECIGRTTTVCDVRIIIDFKKVYTVYIFIDERNGTAATYRVKDEMCLCAFKYVCERGRKRLKPSRKGRRGSSEAVCYQKQQQKNRRNSTTQQQNTKLKIRKWNAQCYFPKLNRVQI